MIPHEMIEAATQLLIERLGPENVARLTFPGEAATTGVILEDIMEAALTAALPQWRGMESAPKQGDLLLAFSTSTNVGISTGRWAEGYWLWGYEEEPTHWLPLPPPPATQE